VNPCIHDRSVASALLSLIVVVWAAFVIHGDARFAGSAVGGVLGITAAVLLVAQLALSAIKRVPRWRTRHRQALRLHVLTSALAAILALLHSGHRFASPLGIALTGAMLATVFSGFCGLYFHGYLATNERGKRDELQALNRRFAALRAALDGRASGSMLPHEAAPMIEPTAARIAELEYSIHFEDVLRATFRMWLRIHVASASAMYALLVVHVWAAIEFGLRWFD
jgi:hypothetical protein